MRRLVSHLLLLCAASPVPAAASGEGACAHAACYRTASRADDTRPAGGRTVATGFGPRFSLPAAERPPDADGETHRVRLTDGGSLVWYRVGGGRLLGAEATLTLAELLRRAFTRIPEQLSRELRQSPADWRAYVLFKRLFLATAVDLRHRQGSGVEVFSYRELGVGEERRLSAWVLSPGPAAAVLKFDARGLDRETFEAVLASLSMPAAGRGAAPATGQPSLAAGAEAAR